MKQDLDAIRQAIEERDEAIQDYHRLASELVYHGNSVSSWYSKATAYKNALGKAWDALNEAGIVADGETDVAAGIRQLALRSNAAVHRRGPE